MRDPGDGMPVCSIKMGECPDNARKAQPTVYVRVVGDVNVVVKIDETVMDDPPVGEPGEEYQRQTDQPACFPVLGGVHRARLTNTHLGRNKSKALVASRWLDHNLSSE